MAGINKVILIGNIGRKPEVRCLENGVKVASFTLATTEIHVNKKGQRFENTEWHNITMWRQLAESAEKYLTVGKQIYVEGRLRTYSWQDKKYQDIRHHKTEIVAETFTMLGSRSKKTSLGDEDKGIDDNDEAMASGYSSNITSLDKLDSDDMSVDNYFAGYTPQSDK